MIHPYVYIYYTMMSVQLYCFQQSLQQMMTLSSDMVSGLKHYHQ